MRKVLFLTGTRADFGKIKSLIQALEDHQDFEPFVIVTGMHLQELYGYTVLEIERCNFSNILKFENHTDEHTMDLTLAQTIEGLSPLVRQLNPDLVVVHGDRIEALAGAIVGALNNVLVAHIEGGELSGTVDEIIRHAVSKLSHIHFVANNEAAKRLCQMGENENSIFEIGSPDLDIMFSDSLPTLNLAKAYYEIKFDDFAVVMYHPVTTEIESMAQYAKDFVDALLEVENNFIIIFPNNDLGSTTILSEYKRLENIDRFRIFPSLRFEYFLTILKNAQFIIGNSSAGIREAPYYGIPTINIGSRQRNRSTDSEIINIEHNKAEISTAIRNIVERRFEKAKLNFGSGNSAQLFLETLLRNETWMINKQKQFSDLYT